MDGVSKPVKRKAFAYITQKSKLLVFEHPKHPEAGIQVPAGSIEADESSEQGAIREAHEETGLQNLSVVQFLGEQIRDMADYGKDEIHHRYFYHLTCDEPTPSTWLNHEMFPSDRPQGDEIHLFRFYWVELANPPKLIADHDYFLQKLDSFTSR